MLKGTLPSQPWLRASAPQEPGRELVRGAGVSAQGPGGVDRHGAGEQPVSTGHAAWALGRPRGAVVPWSPRQRWPMAASLLSRVFPVGSPEPDLRTSAASAVETVPPWRTGSPSGGGFGCHRQCCQSAGTPGHGRLPWGGDWSSRVSRDGCQARQSLCVLSLQAPPAPGPLASELPTLYRTEDFVPVDAREGERQSR